MKYSNATILSLSDVQLLSFGQVLADPQAFPVLWVVAESERPLSLAELSHDMGVDPAELKIIIADLQRDRLVQRKGKSYTAAGWARDCKEFVENAVKDVSLAGAQDDSMGVSSMLVSSHNGSNTIGTADGSAATNNHSCAFFSSQPLVLSRDPVVVRESTSNSGSQTAVLGDP